MKQIFRPLLLIAFFALSHTNSKAQGVFDIRVKDVSGNLTSISEIVNSELIVLDFWATWCKPCVKSIPKLVELSEKYNSKEVTFIGVNEDSPRNTNKVKPFVNSLGISYPVILDSEQEIMSDLLVNSYPTLMVLNSDAEVLFIHEGYTSGDEHLIEEELNKLLAENE